MSYRLNLTINFYQQGEASVSVKTNTPIDQTDYALILLFCNYTCRHLYNLGELSYTLAMVLNEFNMVFDTVREKKEFLKEIVNYVDSDTPKLVDFKGYPGEKRFIALLTYRDKDYVGNFQLKTKGFGILARGMAYYSPTSVMLLLQYLINKNINNEKFLDMISQAILECCNAYKKLSPGNEAQITTTLANKIVGG